MTYSDTRARILDEVEAELYRQDAKWGEQNWPDGTGELYQVIAADRAKSITDLCAQEGSVTYMHILQEEVAEAFAESDQSKLMTELIQVAAVATAWVEKILRDNVSERTL